MKDLFYKNVLYLKWGNSVIGTVEPDCSLVINNTCGNPLVNAYFKGQSVIAPDDFKAFLADRVFSKDRRDVNSLLARLGLKGYDVFLIARATRAFHLTDKFWISYSENEEYETTFVAVFRDLYHHAKNVAGDSIASPGGCNIKQYIFYNEEFGIVKQQMHPYSTDAANEVIAYRLGKLFGVECCFARMISPNAVFSRYEYDINREHLIHARNIVSGEVLSFDNYEDIISKYFLESRNEILQMILFDFIIFQDDRHMSNWAVLMDILGNQRFYKLYDNGRALFYEADEDLATAVINDPEGYSNSFGIVGTYYDVAKDISTKYGVSSLINLNVTREEVTACFNGIEKYPAWRRDACVKYIMWAVGVLRCALNASSVFSGAHRAT